MRIEDAVDLEIFPILGVASPAMLFVCLFGYICLCEHHDFYFFFGFLSYKFILFFYYFLCFKLLNVKR